MMPIVEGYMAEIRAGMQVLEVGCGSWDWIKRRCQHVGASYEAIDVQEAYFGKSVVATRIENLRDLSFHDERFDLVVGNQSMEHWAEHGCSTRWGLYQCFRVCKTGGRVLMNVPIHFHGTRTFMLGDLEAIRRVFSWFSEDVVLEQWGSPSRPLEPLFPHKGYWTLRDKPAFVLDIKARKDRPLPTNVGNGGVPAGPIAQLVNYPLSYNLFRVLRRARLAGAR